MPEITGQLTHALAGRHRIERHIGEGGMASVYLAHDLKHERNVALKVGRPELAAFYVMPFVEDDTHRVPARRGADSDGLRRRRP